jgi:hypothetical protein
MSQRLGPMNGHSTPKVQPATSHVKILEEYFSQVSILLIAIRVTRLGIRPSGDSLLGASILLCKKTVITAKIPMKFTAVKNV